MEQKLRGNKLIKLLVGISDLVIAYAILALYIKYADFTPQLFHTATKMVFMVCTFAMLVAQYFYSTIIHIRRLSFDKALIRTAKLSIVQVILMFLILRILSNSEGYFKFMIIYFFSLYFILTTSRWLERWILKYYRKKGRNTRNVLFVGSDPANLAIYRMLVDDPSTGYRVLGYYGDKEIKDAPETFKKLGDSKDFAEAINENKQFDPEKANKHSSTIVNNTPNMLKIDELFCSVSHVYAKEVMSIIKFCEKNVIRFYYVPRAFADYKFKLKPENFMGYTIFASHEEPLAYPVNKIIKRAFDITVSLIVIIFLLPFFPIIALLIEIQSPGPIFFRQDRTGMNGQTFQCLKFRSMHPNKAADRQQATKDDPRKFPFGNFMRKTNIDEFPQFINVLKGDMSIVGPRPHMLYHTELYSNLIDKYMVRHFAKPGITGWAQVTGYRGETKELWQMEERIKRDIWYIENWTPWLDIKIIFMTAKSLIIPDKNAY